MTFVAAPEDCEHPDDVLVPLPYDGKPADPEEWECRACGHWEIKTSFPINFGHDLQPWQEEMARSLAHSQALNEMLNQRVVLPQPIDTAPMSYSDLSLSARTVAEILDDIGIDYWVDKNLTLRMRAREKDPDPHATRTLATTVDYVARMARGLTFAPPRDGAAILEVPGSLPHLWEIASYAFGHRPTLLRAPASELPSDYLLWSTGVTATYRGVPIEVGRETLLKVLW